MLLWQSSEDDGQGGRRKKKGLKEKIKEKIPGVGGGSGGEREHREEGIHYPQNQGQVKTTTTSTYTTTTAAGHGQLPTPTAAIPTTGAVPTTGKHYHDTTTTTTAHHGDDEQHHEKKSFIEKIKEKLPGTHHWWISITTLPFYPIYTLIIYAPFSFTPFSVLYFSLYHGLVHVFSFFFVFLCISYHTCMFQCICILVNVVVWYVYPLLMKRVCFSQNLSIFNDKFYL